MIRTVGLVCLIAGMAQGCAKDGQWSEFRGAHQKELQPITLNDKTYRIFELSRSSKEGLAVKDDPDATIIVYADVGKGKRVDCGRTVRGCKKAIRKFQGTREVSKKSYKDKKEVLDGM